MKMKQQIVIDNGTDTCKFGFGSEDAPRSCVPNIVGQLSDGFTFDGMNCKRKYIGQEALHKKYMLSLTHPIQQGNIKNWEDLSSILFEGFYNQLGIIPSEHPVLMTENVKTSAKQKETLTQIIFQTFDIKYFYLAKQQVLSLYAAGKTTGVSIQSGEGVTAAVPIYQGYVLPNAIQIGNVNGRDITNYLSRKYNKNINFGQTYHHQAQLQIIKNIKQSSSFVAYDFEKLIKQQNKKNKCLQLPDGSIVQIGQERFESAQGLFQPEMIGKVGLGIHQLLNNSMQRCDPDIKKEMYANIFLSGGNSVIPGIKQRLQKEVNSLIPPNVNMNIRAIPQRRFQSWIGGSILSCLSIFPAMCVQLAEYSQYGASIVHRKCF